MQAISAPIGTCEDWLYDLCYNHQGNHQSLTRLRQKIQEDLSNHEKSPNMNLLYVLPEGIIIGDPEDILNHRIKKQTFILYPTLGLGERLADISFCRQSENSLINPSHHIDLAVY